MFDGAPVLILEDDDLIAIGLAETVSDLGGSVIGPIATVAEALVILDDVKVEAAILDGHLADRDVSPIALVLMERGVPLVIFTGSALPEPLAAWHAVLSVVQKPASPRSVVQRLAALYTDGRADKR